ncbi:MAG: type II toxin-antitoxin system death-on-curing family toxin [Patescibacteria group bacterium]
MRYLSAIEILAIHDRVVEETGGSLGVREEGLLSSLSERPKSSFGGIEKFSTLFLKAASYLEAIAMYHVFIDGNKRTALSVAAIFLRANGYVIELPIEESEHYMVGVVTKKPSVEEVAAWLEKHSRKI